MDTVENVVCEIPVHSRIRRVCVVFLLRPFLPRFPRSVDVQAPTSNILFLLDTESIGSLPGTSPQVRLRRRSLLTFHSQLTSSSSPSASQDLQVLSSPQNLDPRYLKDLVDKISLASLSLFITDRKIKCLVNLSRVPVRYRRTVDRLKSIS